MNDLRPLKGARIWLSGSILEQADGAALASFQAFVRKFADLVFAQGGTIVHGCHPSITPTLIDAAEHHRKNQGKRDALLLAASQFHRKLYAGDLERWRRSSIVHEEPAVPNDRELSLARLRVWMADRCDAMVAIGGKWWRENRGVAGVPQEFELARSRGLPCFLLGGLGGAAADFVEAYPEVLRNLRNGLDEAKNAELAVEPNIEAMVAQVYGQLCRLPLVRGEKLGDSTFRILALDGGGIKGTFTAAVLTAFERALVAEEAHRLIKERAVEDEKEARKLAEKSVRLTDYFDMIAGTSTGGILALGLGMGLRAEDMLAFYEKRGPTVFPIINVRDDPVLTFGAKLLKAIRSARKPKNDAEVLKDELEEAFKNAPRQTLGTSLCRLVIPSVQALTGAAHMFCTNHHPNLVADAGKSPVEVALATAAAPTFFRAATIDDRAYLDGGLWANNPTLAALAEAVGRLQVPLNRVDILSIGTTSEPQRENPRNGGFVDWIRGLRIINLLMYAQEQGTITLTKSLATPARVLRIDQTLVPGTVSLDNAAQIPKLKEYGLIAGEHSDTFADVRARFLNGIKAADWKAQP
jgi:patatin-like phospholipase/acyl hydrolase